MEKHFTENNRTDTYIMKVNAQKENIPFPICQLIPEGYNVSVTFLFYKYFFAVDFYGAKARLLYFLLMYIV